MRMRYQLDSLHGSLSYIDHLDVDRRVLRCVNSRSILWALQVKAVFLAVHIWGIMIRWVFLRSIFFKLLLEGLQSDAGISSPFLDQRRKGSKTILLVILVALATFSNLLDLLLCNALTKALLDHEQLAVFVIYILPTISHAGNLWQSAETVWSTARVQKELFFVLIYALE